MKKCPFCLLAEPFIKALRIPETETVLTCYKSSTSVFYMLRGWVMNRDLSLLEERIGYVFRDKALLKTALTHSSYCNEVRIGNAADNERLEFLGDAVLELVSSEYIFNRFSGSKEGEMSRMRAYAVCEESLFERAKDIELGEFIILGEGAKKQGGRTKPSIVSDAMEAVIAGIYLDGGLECAKKFILEKILEKTEFDTDVIDPKSALSEYFQAQEAHEQVKYRIISESGPTNDREFVVQAYVGEKDLETGTGRSLKNAEKQAAFKTLKKIREKK